MGYFNELPELLYPSLLPKSTRSDEKIRVKNLFRRAKLRNDSSAFTLSELYQIEEGERPDMLAEKLYEILSEIFPIKPPLILCSGVLNAASKSEEGSGVKSNLL